ncbi:MAG: hypothetical protein VKS61_15535 [Candidatus Sericytochromatia bacterium]|nr:hypothetical protein [Candidatus Sericytochromatia bacterium]
MRGRARAAALVAGIGALLLPAAPADAYPTSLIFAPTGDVAAAGASCLSFYNAFYGTAVDCWTGYNVGILPGFPYGDSGLVFPGLEVGIDVLASPGRLPAIKPVGNLKLGLLAEADVLPSLALGYMSVAVLHPASSLNLAYLSATKTVEVGGRRLGRLTLGSAYAMPRDPDEFTPTWPAPNSNATYLAGWEFPAVGPFSFAIDSIGGVSEISGTCLVMNLEIVPGTFASVGYAISHDRDAAYPDGYFFQTYTNFDVITAISPPADGPAAPSGQP